ncbi:unnamed protein product [Protopolystoma xenopodis]|uniref:DDE-1 domain-containing protein n=1 Tax=Protopolystoma xenopodis TaxID=117903 RepID=A0A448WVY4_9PLAT|nr:unnamed protein product [Protopolystoma xenopodis]
MRPSNRTVNLKGAKTVSIKTTGNEKNRYSVVLGCAADGTKLKPMLIFKRKTFPKEEIPDGILLHMHEKGWMDTDGMQIWFKKIFGCRPRALLNKPTLLVFYSFRGHLTEDVKKIA